MQKCTMSFTVVIFQGSLADQECQQWFYSLNIWRQLNPHILFYLFLLHSMLEREKLASHQCKQQTIPQQRMNINSISSIILCKSM